MEFDICTFVHHYRPHMQGIGWISHVSIMTMELNKSNLSFVSARTDEQNNWWSVFLCLLFVLCTSIQWLTCVGGLSRSWHIRIEIIDYIVPLGAWTIDTVNISSCIGVTEWMIGKETATSIESNHRTIRPLYIITAVNVHCIGLDSVCDYYPLESVSLRKYEKKRWIYEEPLAKLVTKPSFNL